MRVNSTTEQAPLCACGCGQPVLKSQVRNEWNRFIVGHNSYGMSRSKPLIARFWLKVNKSGPIPAHRPKLGPCWLWQGTTNDSGYGIISGPRPKRQQIRVHRISWEIHNAPIPDNLWVLHKCDIRNCVNPKHLFLGDNTDNFLDMIGKGRFRPGRMPGEKHPQHKLTIGQIMEIRARHAMGQVTCSAIANEYGICKSTVCRIVKHISWK